MIVRIQRKKYGNNYIVESFLNYIDKSKYNYINNLRKIRTDFMNLLRDSQKQTKLSYFIKNKNNLHCKNIIHILKPNNN